MVCCDSKMMENINANMAENCNSNNQRSTNEKDYEIIKLEKTKAKCDLCEDFSNSKSSNKENVAIISCEGACLRGEISRRVANGLCFNEYPENTARVCLGGAFTKNTGQRNMVQTAKRAIALEGCFINCASRMMNGILPGLNVEVIHVDKYYTFDKQLFAINDVTEAELIKFSKEATENIKNIIKI